MIILYVIQPWDYWWNQLAQIRMWLASIQVYMQDYSNSGVWWRKFIPAGPIRNLRRHWLQSQINNFLNKSIQYFTSIFSLLIKNSNKKEKQAGNHERIIWGINLVEIFRNHFVNTWHFDWVTKKIHSLIIILYPKISFIFSRVRKARTQLIIFSISGLYLM